MNILTEQRSWSAGFLLYSRSKVRSISSSGPGYSIEPSIIHHQSARYWAKSEINDQATLQPCPGSDYPYRCWEAAQTFLKLCERNRPLIYQTLTCTSEPIIRSETTPMISSPPNPSFLPCVTGCIIHGISDWSLFYTTNYLKQNTRMFQSIEINEYISMRQDKVCFNSSTCLIDNICFRQETSNRYGINELAEIIRGNFIL